MPIRVYNKSKIIDGETGGVDNTTSTENTIYDEEGRPWTLAPNETKVFTEHQDLTFIGNSTVTLGTTSQQTYASQIGLDYARGTGNATITDAVM